MSLLSIGLILLIVFVGQILHATVGFGDALLAMPLLTLIVGVRTATPLVALLATTATTLILWQSWREIDMGSAWRLVAASLPGIPVGVWLVRYAPEAWVIGGLGLLVLGFALYSLFQPMLPQVQSRIWVIPAGFLAGVLGAAYNTNGPPVILYGTLRRWTAPQFRATLQGFFFPSGLLILTSHGLGGLWNREVFTLYAYCLPVALIAVWLGSRLNQRIPAQRFTRLIYGILVVLGSILIAQSVGLF
ncbi:MAG: sulfite exporter TauE/SafE family protein [Caldilineaceae bacterium]|nr:sulfite exporter TauE/SafE family protein [Caldilineaceae bacterium]MBP8109094.1 sulfite exporter TauE/SafE family protein [Caldilineaceae bacterium]MBP8124170.1 sulfite exporter TauE/SafE family protein [Caldilineaceae bacterium]MBP9073326.1 sulfite exporter TauE/SafE family protein [Caldilineaceae bacterium]